ncbi:hypothetical protein, partial [Pseudomonas sp. EL_65y_Pfl1_R83]|uniref:hypothetical protein n=1 Tax=Pseudomonas sp. EL_65y_Pfl1_R83 TaxID=3088697 RepID=UPI0030DC5759
MHIAAHIGMFVPRQHPHPRDRAFDLDQQRLDKAVEARRIAKLPALPSRQIGIVVIRKRSF